MRRVLLLVATALVALAAAAAGSGAPAAPPVTQQPGALTVGVAMPSEGFQVGVVKGSQVLYAQGFEIDLAKALAIRLGLPRTVFVQERFDRLFSAGVKPFDVAIAQISITPARARVIDFSRPYMSVDQGVLVAQTVTPVPRTLAALKTLRLCSLAKSTGADAVRTRIAPTRPVHLVGNVQTLMLHLQTGRCDAVVYDAPTLGTLKRRAPDRYGPFVGVIQTGERYGVVAPAGSTLLGRVNKALASLIADGTVDRFATTWLTVDPADLRVLR
jgi:polar amino acid transport system substrate-binding protein